MYVSIAQKHKSMTTVHFFRLGWDDLYKGCDHVPLYMVDILGDICITTTPSLS